MTASVYSSIQAESQINLIFSVSQIRCVTLQVSAQLTPVTKSKVAVAFKEFKVFGLIGVKAPETARGLSYINLQLVADIALPNGLENCLRDMCGNFLIFLE